MWERKDDIPLGYRRFWCKCGYHVDFLKDKLPVLKATFAGMDCPECGKTIRRWL